MHFHGRTFNDVAIGETFGSAITITEHHVATACGLFGDFNPLHCNETFARQSRFGGRVLHGVFTSALMGSCVGMYFEGTAIGYLEHNCRFLQPVYIGDTLTTTWTIDEKLPKPKHNGGVVRLSADCVNQRGEAVASAEGAMLVGNGSAADGSP